MKRYGFVVPRFGDGIVGGAETLVAGLASQLALRGDEIEVLTTCAKDNRTWQNEFLPGESFVGRVCVKRFPVDQRDLEVWVPRQISISEGMALLVDDQLEWLSHSVNSSPLYSYVNEKAELFDALFFAPYLFGTTFWGSLIHPEKSYLIPCLHNEKYAYVDVIGSMFRQVAGALFNSIPEMELAQSLYGGLQGGEVGLGFDAMSETEVQGLTPFFEEEFPYILYAGRKETGKNVHFLVDCFIEMKESRSFGKDVKLVIAGGGSFDDVERPTALRRADVIDLPHVSNRDKRRLIRHANCLCQPSLNESFSIVLMEAWLLGTPVVVHSGCPVTRYHVVQSGGGLYFHNASDFSLVIEELLKSSRLRAGLGMAGKRYVGEQYNWPTVLSRFDSVMREFVR